MRRRQEMEREAAVTFMSKKTGDSGSASRLDELPTAGRMTRQNTTDDRIGSKTELVDRQKLRFVYTQYSFELVA